MAFFTYRRRVAYHETDAMGVVHHSNHVKYFEEARVAWLRDRGLMPFHAPQGPYVFAVTALDNRYFKPAYFDDELEVWVQGRLEGARIRFQYALYRPAAGAVVADGRTELVAIDPAFRPARLPREFIDRVRGEPWDEIWPPAL